MSATVTRKLQQARDALAKGDVDAAAAACEDVLQRAARNPDALWLLGTARLMARRADEAVSLFQRVLETAPGHGAALENLGLANLMLGRYGAAEDALRKAASIAGAPPSVHMRLGLALLHQSKHAEAVTTLEAARRRSPHDADLLLAVGRAYAGSERWADASRAFEAVLQRAPDHVDALYNLGVASVAQRALDRALSAFSSVLAQAPNHRDARERRAEVCLVLGRFPQAAEDLRALTAADPMNARLTRGLAEAVFQVGDSDEALKIAARARDLDPQHAGAYSLISQIHHVRGALDLAVDALERGYDATRADALLGALVHLTHRQCDWPKWQTAWERMAGRLDASSELGSPFWLLHEATTAEQQLSYTRRWVERTYPSAAGAGAPRRRATRERLRIGYYSGDFHQHPVACLLVEALELHDRSRFEFFAYSYGPDDGSALRARLTRSVEHFIDVAWDPNDLVANRIRADELDLLIDLKGYTAGDRLNVMAQRPCRVQAAWLGYPGTTGAPFIDYLIADEVLVPEGAEHRYSERVLRLPHSYQANDRKREASASRTRAEYGLPQDAVVFCSFNQTVKMTPEIFTRWMSLLARVPGSVLWLLDDNPWASRNLKAAASAAGIAPERIVMARRVPNADHLARYRVADLALDTFPYTSHTTGSDALWLGCPLVALRGDTFAARVSTSLLFNCGLPELAASSLDEYESLAVRLATDGDYRREIRARVAAARDTAPLFDTERFTRDLEALYVRIAG